MARRKFRFRRHPITLTNQSLHIESCCPSFKLEKRSPSSYIWIGTLQPTPLSQIYKVKIEYRFRYIPKVYVLSPPLKSRDKKTKIPHIYGPKQPCVFLPKSREWSSEKSIAKTIIPWLSLWLFYYEVWLSIGEWLGGGVHPPPGEDKELE